MPIYAYRCTSCDHELEVLQSINDPNLVTCPECEQPALKKQVVAPAFTFKGSGWYKDLYSSSDTKGGEKKKDKISTPAPVEKAKTTTASEKKSKKD